MAKSESKPAIKFLARGDDGPRVRVSVLEEGSDDSLIQIHSGAAYRVPNDQLFDEAEAAEEKPKSNGRKKSSASSSAKPESSDETESTDSK